MPARDFDPPIIINCRDRVTPLRNLVDWCERAGHERIVLLDNASTYEPLRDYLASMPHDVLQLDENLGSRALWRCRASEFLRSDWFVYTDPDIIPIDDCPDNAVAVLRDALDSDKLGHSKAALGLYLDDVPTSMPSLSWEMRLLNPHPKDAWMGHI
ncbi:MAG TPA: hypothetical protein VGI86_14990, partial [Acidimicrobiia bacterium]